MLLFTLFLNILFNSISFEDIMEASLEETEAILAEHQKFVSEVDKQNLFGDNGKKKETLVS